MSFNTVVQPYVSTINGGYYGAAGVIAPNRYRDCTFIGGIFTDKVSSSSTYFPQFDGGYFESCDFSQLPSTTLLIFFSKCIFINCTFGENQKIQVEESVDFIDCKNVNLTFANAGTYTFKADGSSISFPDFTADTYTDTYKINLTMLGGKLTLPSVSVTSALDFKLDCTGTYITAPANHYSGLQAKDCVIQAADELYIAKAEGCDIYFNGNSGDSAKLALGMFVGNEIKIGTPEATTTDTKSKVIFDGEMNIANRIQGLYNTNPITMTKGENAKVVAYNYNGVTTL